MSEAEAKPLRCPKCRGLKVSLVETGTWTTEHFLDGSSNNEPQGYFKLEGSCACGHRWRVRGHIQFSDLEHGPRLAENARRLRGVRPSPEQLQRAEADQRAAEAAHARAEEQWEKLTSGRAAAQPSADTAGSSGETVYLRVCAD